MNDTTKRHPRTMAEAFGPHETPVIEHHVAPSPFGGWTFALTLWGIFAAAMVARVLL